MSGDKKLAKRLDDPMFGDAYVAGLVATAVVAIAGGWGVLAGVALGVVIGVPAVFVIAIAIAVCTGGDDRSLIGRVLACGVLGVVLGEVGRQLVGWPGLAVGALGFAYTGARAAWRHGHVLKDMPHAPAALPAAVTDAIEALPAALGPDLRARVDVAVEDFKQLHEVLGDPSLAGAPGVDAAAMLAEAQQILQALLRDAPRVARVQALADRREDDAPAREAAATAFAALGQRADALHQAASAAIRLAAALAAGDTSALQEHTANLHLLSAAHQELGPPGG